MSDNTQRTLKVAETAERLGVSTDALYQAIRESAFPPARRIGRRIVISVVALERWLEGVPDV